MSSDSPAQPPPQGVEDSGTLSETASKLERLKELTRKYSVSEVVRKEEETEQSLESHEVIELQAFVRHKEWIDDKIKVTHGPVLHRNHFSLSPSSSLKACRPSTSLSESMNFQTLTTRLPRCQHVPNSMNGWSNMTRSRRSPSCWMLETSRSLRL